MKNIIIILTALIGLTSCSKTEALIPAENVTPVVDTTITQYFNVEIPYYNITLINLQPYKYGFIVDSNDIKTGRVYFYKDEATHTDYTVFFEYNEGITNISGNINSHPFGTITDLDHINVCNSVQNIEIFYSISTSKVIINH